MGTHARLHVSGARAQLQIDDEESLSRGREVTERSWTELDYQVRALSRARDGWADAAEQNRAAWAERAREALATLSSQVTVWLLGADVSERLTTVLNAGSEACPIELALELTDPDPGIVAALQSIPWEAISVTPDRPPIGIWPGVSVTRVLQPSHNTPDGPRPGQLRLLAALSNPVDAETQQLDATGELSALVAAVEHDDANCDCAVVAARVEALAASVAVFKPHVLHLSAHGGPGQLVLTDWHGRRHLATAATLVEAVKAYDGLRVVVLSSCLSATTSERTEDALATALLNAGVEAVIAMATEVTEALAIAFCTALYRDLARTGSSRLADVMASARRAVASAEAGLPTEWSVPVLFERLPVTIDVAPRASRSSSLADGVHLTPVLGLDYVDRPWLDEQLSNLLRVGERRVGLIYGPPGVGKSAAVAHAVSRLPLHGLALRTGRVERTELLAAFAEAFRAGESDPSSVAERALAALERRNVTAEEGLAAVEQLADLADGPIVAWWDGAEAATTVRECASHPRSTWWSVDDDLFDLLTRIGSLDAKNVRLVITSWHLFNARSHDGEPAAFGTVIGAMSVGPLTRLQARRLIVRHAPRHLKTVQELGEVTGWNAGHMLQLAERLEDDPGASIDDAYTKIADDAARSVGIDRLYAAFDPVTRHAAVSAAAYRRPLPIRELASHVRGPRGEASAEPIPWDRYLWLQERGDKLSADEPALEVIVWDSHTLPDGISAHLRDDLAAFPLLGLTRWAGARAVYALLAAGLMSAVNTDSGESHDYEVVMPPWVATWFRFQDPVVARDGDLRALEYWTARITDALEGADARAGVDP